MKNVKKTSLLIISILLFCALAFGCTVIPEEYTKGVRLDRDYPDDDMPLMDDALVYFSEDDDDEITIKYGVSDDLDDVVDFYKDHFEDNDIVLDSESDKSTKYSAEGFYKNFMFKVRVTKPSGEYEEKQFVTTVKIEIEFTKEAIGTVSVDNGSLEDEIVGFWRQESFANEDGKFASDDAGTAYEFTPDGTLNLYRNFEFTGAGSWTPIDNSSLLLTYAQGDQEKVTVTFEKRSGYDYLIIQGSVGTLVFYEETADDFGTQSTVVMTPPPGTDSQLAAALADTRWYYVHYSDVDGETVSTYTGDLIYYSDGTLEDTFDNETVQGTWYVEDGWLNCDYSDDTSSGWIVEVKNEGGINYLYFYSSDAPAYWLYSDNPSGEDSNMPTVSSTYTTDADLTTFIVVAQWNELHYLYANGSTDPMDKITLTFMADGLFEETYDGVFSDGTWNIESGVLKLKYNDTQDIYSYPAFIEYDDVSDTFFLYFGDLAEGFEGNNWVFTTYQP